MIYTVPRKVRFGIQRPSVVHERLGGGENEICGAAQPAFRLCDLRSVEISKFRPLVDTVIDDQGFAQFADVVRGVRKERPELEFVHPQAAAQRRDYDAKDSP